MQQLSPNPFRQLLGRLSRGVAEINVVLLVIAIGLAVLDVTSFVTLQAPVVIARAQAEAAQGTPAEAPER